MVARYIPKSERYAELYVLLFPNGKRYFGISKDHKLRFKNHCKRARSNSPRKLPVHCAIAKYGAVSVQVKVLAIGYRKQIAELEIGMIAVYDTTNHKFGYNWSNGGERGPMLGKTFKMSDEAKQKLRIIGKQRGMPREVIEAARIVNTGRTYSDETRALWSRQRRVLKRTPEWCTNISAAKTGKKRSASDREAMRIRRTGTTHSEVTKARMVVSQQARRARERQMGVV